MICAVWTAARAAEGRGTDPYETTAAGLREDFVFIAGQSAVLPLGCWALLCLPSVGAGDEPRSLRPPPR